MSAAARSNVSKGLDAYAPQVVGLALLVAGIWTAARIGALGDDPGKAQPALTALFNGDLQGFFDKQPLMGSLSLYVRAPFAGIADALSLEPLASYRLQSIPMIASAAALGWYGARLMRERGRSLLAQVVVAALLVAGPVTADAFTNGHPEEILGATLCTAAVLAGMRNAAIWSGLFVGLAVATKQWGLIALGPALVALASGRTRMVAIAAVTAIVLTAPMAIGSPTQFREINITRASKSVPTVDYYSVWWLARETEQQHIDVGLGAHSVERYHAPNWAVRLSHPLTLLLTIPLCLLYLRRRRPGSDDVLLLLACCLLLRCVLDPGNLVYYHLPFIFALAVWEGLQTRGIPVIALLASVLVTAHWWKMPAFDQVSVFAIYFVWVVPLFAWMFARIYAPEQLDRLIARVQQSGSTSPSPTQF